MQAELEEKCISHEKAESHFSRTYFVLCRHIYIFPNKVVHCRTVCAYPEFFEVWKYFETGKKGVRASSHSPVIADHPRPMRSISAETRAHFSAHGSGWRVRPWSTQLSLRCAYQRAAHTCVRERVCVSARPRANACTLVIVLHTHVRVVRGVVLRPPPFPLAAVQQPPFPRCNRRTSQFPCRLPLSRPFVHRATRGPHPYDLFYRRHVVPSLSPFPPSLPFPPIWRHAVTNHIMFAALTLARRKDYF